MDPARVGSPPSSSSDPSFRSRSIKAPDEAASLTSFNPFSEEDENDQSSYALVSSLFYKVRNTFSGPLSSAVAVASGSNNPITEPNPVERRRPSLNSVVQNTPSHPSLRPVMDRRPTLQMMPSNPAPALLSLTPVVSETPSYSADYDPPSRGGMYSPIGEFQDSTYGTAIPGFPIQDDARSIKTSTSLKRSASVSKVIRRIRGEGLSRDYWMDDETCKECYDCKSVFTTWRRKHHCRICGQIFCSRCASNVIKGSRFGHEGMIRVCNLCLEKLAKVDDDDDDDRRSIISTSTSPFAAHQMGHESLSLGLGSYSQSPFASSQLWGRQEEPLNLWSIAEAEARRQSGSDESGFGSRPITPNDLAREDGTWGFARKALAPFRRGFAEEEKDNATLTDTFNHDQSPTGPGAKTPVDFPVTVPVSTDGAKSSIQFPSSADNGPDSPGPNSLVRTRFNSYADFEASTPFIRSRVQSRLLDTALSTGEPGWRTRRESTAYAQELNLLSMFHLRLMVRQMLTKEEIPNVPEWEESLLKLALRIAKELTFTAHPHRQGTDMDVRRYVKIKKIPGGSPRDSEYVDGAVITKNVTHKSMSRSQWNPRVMLVTFPLEFNRVEGQYHHFSQITQQEKQYLGNLCSRIAALSPHIVLVEKSVSRLALDALAKYNIAVARSVKPSAVQFVSRMTQGDIFSSIDKLALEPRLGNCRRYRIQTFDHPLIPGRRKTYMRFEGCSKEMGCTIVLRGGNIDTLRRIKKVTRFLTLVVRNLKLETHLWKDSLITLPPLSYRAVPASYNPSLDPQSESQAINPFADDPTPTAATSSKPDNTDAISSAVSSEDVQEDDLPDEEAKQIRLSRQIQQSLEPYLTTFISISATLRFLPPHPIRRMKELDNELIRAKRAWEDDTIRREEMRAPAPAHQHEITITPATFDQSQPLSLSLPSPQHSIEQSPHEDLNAQIEALTVPERPITPSSTDGVTPTFANMTTEPGYFDYKALPSASQTSLVSSLALSPGPAALQPSLEVSPLALLSESDIKLQSELSHVKWLHQEQQRVWQWYLRKNADDFVVEKYQCISMWELTLPVDEYGVHAACFPPRLQYITYYGENDCTLGQFIDARVAEQTHWRMDLKLSTCTGKACNELMANHCKVYVHNETRIFVATEPWDAVSVARGLTPPPEMVTTWSNCRVCGCATPVIPVSEEMQRYSFAKFLELHFYPAEVQLVQGAGCEHNIYQHHVRHFATRGMTVRFQADPITLHEIVYPPMRIRVRPETQLQLKNQDYERLMNRSTMWYTALIDDLKLINIDAAIGDEEADTKLTADINQLINRAELEKAQVARLINEIYTDSAPTDTLALNQVRSFRQDKIVAWQADFDRLPKPKSEKAGRRTSTFGTVRAMSMWPRRYELAGALEHPHMPSSSVSEVDEPTLMRRTTAESFTSASEASETSEAEADGGISRPSREDTLVPASTKESSAESSATQASGTDEPASSSVEGLPRSDPESDSTIGAPKAGLPSSVGAITSDGERPGPTERPSKGGSRLPRRPIQQPSVAELVKKYQDFLPSQGMEELAKTALSPLAPAADSDQEITTAHLPSRTTRNRMRQLVRKASNSDFESSYAANIAPRYLTHSRRHVRQASYGSTSSKIPGPVVSSFDSQEPSRQPSPEKRPPLLTAKSDATVVTLRAGRTSPPLGRRALGPTAGPSKPPRTRLPTSGAAKEKAPSRPTSSGGSKSSFRRPPGTPGGKVSNIAKHFERINRDNERANRRYAVIRGRRARPVASARARVEILDSVKDAIRDESESSSSSSEADDEGGDEDEGQKPSEQMSPDSSNKTSPEASGTLPEVTMKAEPESTNPNGAARSPPPASEQTGSEAGPSKPPIEPSSAPKDREMVLSVPPSPLLSGIFPHFKETLSPPPSDFELGPGHERSSILKAFTNLWPQQLPPRLRGEFEVEDPMADPEHIFRDSSMVVRTDEPTSIIALALNSPQYRDMLFKSRAEKRHAKEPRLGEGGEAFMPDDHSVAESNSTWGVVNVESTEGANPTEELRVPSSKSPWAITFESAGLTISCTVLYPEQFDALRRTYDCEKSMIESLSRCIKWNASGGKSGSAFLKTRDDRFIAKEMSRAELQTMETFAPAYFDYMSSAVDANRPTLLAKVFGCFKITFGKNGKDRGQGRARATQMNLLVMENLFYDRRYSKIYDLKGSTRNRHVQSTGRENEVLLDENLVETAHLAPFYLREHSKRILRGALYNDSKFLADINVMDYSLVVGVDSAKNELVVGIVDYVRTYTWDKKLESWVKESAFLGGAGKGEPTIVTPKQYRQRFISAMERYFPLVPDRWTKQKDAPEEEGNSLLELWPDW